MQIIQCPHCGAPPPPGFVPPSGQFRYACAYCRRPSVLGTPEPPPPQAQLPAIIVVQAPRELEHHHHAAVAQAHAVRGVSWLVWVVVVLLVSLGGSGAAFMQCTKHSSLLSSLVWDGTEPLHCSGNDQISVTGVEATFTAGTAIVADGNCHVRCTDCQIAAPTAIETSGNAQVTIINGSVRGTSILASASGNSRVMISGNVTVAGRTQERANGKVSAPPPPSPIVGAPAPEPAPSPSTPAAKAVKTPLPTKVHATQK